MHLHRELTALGLPPRFLTDEYLEIYQCMQESERSEFLSWFKALKNDVAECEKDIVFSSAAKERYMGMTFVEKADYIGLDNLKLMKLKHARSLHEDSMKLQRIERELEELIRIAETSPSSSTESIASFGESLERMNVHHTALEDTTNHHTTPSRADMGLASQDSQSKPSRKLSSFKSASELISVVEKFAGEAIHNAYGKLHSARKANSSVRKAEQSEETSFSFDSGVEVLSNNMSPKTAQSVREESSHGLVSKVKSGFFVNRKSHPPRSLKKTESRRDLKQGFRISSFDSDAVQLHVGGGLSTAKEAIVTAPTMVKITPPSSVHLVSGSGYHPVIVTVKEVSSEEAPRYSSTATTAVESCAGNQRFEKQKAIAESLSSQSDTSTSSSESLGSIKRRDLFKAAEEYVNEKQELPRKPSFWTLGRRRAPDLEASGDVEFAKAFKDSKKPKTLRKMISTIFGMAKVPAQEAEHEVPAKNEGEGCRSNFESRRRLFRKTLPTWESSV